MDTRRIGRLIRGRWGVVAIGGLLGLVGAFVFLAVADRGAVSLFEATAPMRFDPAEGQTVQDLAPDIRDARDFALIAAADLLAEDSTSQIALDLAEAGLLFIAQDDSEALASDKARALRQSYLDVDPSISGGVDAAIAKLVAEAVDLDAQIAALQPELTPVQQTTVDELAHLDQLTTAIETQLVALVLAEAAATTTDERNALSDQQSRLEARLTEFQDRKALLGPAPVAEMTTTDALLLDTLLTRKELLNTEYQRLFLRQLGVAGLGTAEQITVTNFASEPIDPILLASVGLFGGVIMAVVGLLGVSRARRTVWLPEDLDVPVLGLVPARGDQSHSIEGWYDTADSGPRKTAVQALRSAVQAQAHGTGTTMALTGHHISAHDLQALAADLAGSMASAGDSVLLIDADFSSSVALGDYRIAGSSLADILRFSSEAPDLAEKVDRAVAHAQIVRPGLSILPAGPPPGSPADALAGRQFRSLIQAAEARYDTTIVVVDEFGTPAAQTAMQRLRHGILVTAPGATTESEINGLLADAERVRIGVEGAVFLGSSRRFSHLFSRGDAETRPVQHTSQDEVTEQSAPSPMARLQSYAIPDERRSGLVDHSPLGDLAESFGVSDSETDPSGLGVELLNVVRSSQRGKAYDAVAEYAVTRAEDMATARYGYADLAEDLISEVSENGFLSFKPISGHRTVGEWIVREIEDEVGRDVGGEVTAEFCNILGAIDEDSELDVWLGREFFNRHLIRTGGEPEVWHLVSPARTVSILVPARRLTLARAEGVLALVVSNMVDELERRRKEAVTSGDIDLASGIEQQIWDVRMFEKNFERVIYRGQGGGSKRSKSSAWVPDWSRGTRNNLAPFQEAGLLPFEVLSDDEITELLGIA